jgi:hypothetical protein
MVNKKILFLILLGVLVLPAIVLGVGPTLPGLATSIENAAITIGVTLVTIGWLIAGILYLTAAGSPEKVETAKKAMIACVIGTLLVVLATTAGSIANIIKDAFGLQ